jgi:hypothetical protein
VCVVRRQDRPNKGLVVVMSLVMVHSLERGSYCSRGRKTGKVQRMDKHWRRQHVALHASSYLQENGIWIHQQQQSTTTINNDHGQTPVPVTLTDGVMRNQRDQSKELRSQILNVNHLDHIPRTELVSAKSMTAIVKHGRFLAFSDARSGGWVFDRFSKVTHASHAQASTNASSCELAIKHRVEQRLNLII